ncbi:FMN-binding domain protein [[Clostridium] ultunense Esp]|uniref:FMN-binding protein n=1 Tax=Schnuerera ultunensis TaxID=45497 RepID=UPI0002B707B1|nr:FMN-binding protein [Schnuerera ultunensis]CCQ97499.1 FMN-binding domain protein [[Clostridium] ultunense Esp]
MKRVTKVLLAVLVIASLTVTLTGCGSSDNSNEEVTYKDGTYIGESEKREFGYEEAEVTIEGGKITNIVLKRMTPDGEEVDYDEWTGEGDRPNLKQFRVDLAEEMIEKQSYEVDAIATATETSEGWKEAVKNSLEQAK